MQKPRESGVEVASGVAAAAFLAAGIGAFSMGALVILNEIGVFSAPALYRPAGGVSGRTTIAVIIWLIAWALLHNRWKAKEVDLRTTFTVTLVLIGLGVLFTFPPFWSLIT